MKVIKKQTNSKNCIICGLNNEFGLKAPFYEMEDGSVISIVKYSSAHQSFPERVHGGMIASLLDEIIGRAIWIEEPNTWGVTMDLSIKYRKPVPYDSELKCVGKIIKNGSRTFDGIGELYDSNSNLLATAKATYFKAPLEKISKRDCHSELTQFMDDNIKEI